MKDHSRINNLDALKGAGYRVPTDDPNLDHAPENTSQGFAVASLSALLVTAIAVSVGPLVLGFLSYLADFFFRLGWFG